MVQSYSFGYCYIPHGSILVIWKHLPPSGNLTSVKIGKSPRLSIHRVTKDDAGVYFYEIIDRNQGTVLFTSHSSKFVQVFCEY